MSRTTGAYRIGHHRPAATLRAVIVLIFFAVMHVAAQEPGVPPPPLEPPVGFRPIILDVEFLGNSTIPSEQLSAQIETRATHVPLLKRYLTLVSDFFDTLPGFLFPRYYQRDGRLLQPMPNSYLLRRTIDSLGGEVRYLNWALLESDIQRIRTLYFDYGFHDVQVDYHVRLDTTHGTSIVQFNINENHRFPLHSITYIGLEGVPEDIRATITEPRLVTINDGFSKSELTAETDRVVADLKNNGYPFAASRPPLILVVRERDSVAGAPYDSALVFIYTGERHRFGAVTFTSDSTYDACKFSEETILAQCEFSPGDWYERRKIDQTIENLYSLGIFDFASVDTVGVERSHEDMPMSIAGRFRKNNDGRVGVDFGYEQRVSQNLFTIGANGSYTRYNAFCTEGHLTGSGRITVPSKNFADLLTFQSPYFLNQGQGGGTISYFFPAPFRQRRLSLKGAASYENTVVNPLHLSTGEDVTMRAQSWELAGDVAYRFPRYTFFSLATARIAWQRNSYIHVKDLIKARAKVLADEAMLTATGCDTNDVRNALVDVLASSTYRVPVVQGGDPDMLRGRDTVLAKDFDALKDTWLLGGSVAADHRDDIFAPRHGNIVDVHAELGGTGRNPANLIGGFVKLEGNMRFFTTAGSFTYAARVHGGYIFDVGRTSLIPATSRFIVGGANSMRGWAARDLLATRPVGSLTTLPPGCADLVLDTLTTENRRVLGGLCVLEFSAETRWRPFNSTSNSTLMQQINLLEFEGFIDVGNAYFRDRDDIGQINILQNLGVDVGVTGGYVTPVGPLRIGVGIPVYDPTVTESYDRQRWVFNRQFLSTLTLVFGLGHAF